MPWVKIVFFLLPVTRHHSAFVAPLSAINLLTAIYSKISENLVVINGFQHRYHQIDYFAIQLQRKETGETKHEKFFPVVWTFEIRMLEKFGAGSISP